MSRLDWFFHLGGCAVTVTVAAVLKVTGVIDGDGMVAMICTGIGWLIHATAGDTLSTRRSRSQ